MSKVCWDNALLVNPSTARDLGLKDGGMVRVELAQGNRSLEVPIAIMPGHYPGSATLALGYGRRFDGRIAAGAGVDAYALRTSEAMGFVTAGVTAIRGEYALARTQDHYAFDTMGGRGKQQRLPSIYREATLAEYAQRPNFANEKIPHLHVVHRLSAWREDHPFHGTAGYPGAEHAWAMSIDLSACTGCQACVAACQAENNIPIVGKEQVRMNREMHWLRVDRYFKGGTDAQPEGVGFMAVPCMQCENAPCEQVCPVAATVHDRDGLNVMVYNRCIGTRYCSNNCPYKVRRFNYFDFHRRQPRRDPALVHVNADYYATGQSAAHPLRQMQWNPEVSLRSRGVMEKCTYCTQRITRGKIVARNQWRALPEEEKRGVTRLTIEDGAITPACAQACPAEAIVFGDLLDPNSRVSQLHRHERTYELLEELNTKPRTRYMAKLRNPAT
jgi:Fe-S-cluster-containing dehydrogenase component